jgi:hypothetical protein
MHKLGEVVVTRWTVVVNNDADSEMVLWGYFDTTMKVEHRPRCRDVPFRKLCRQNHTRYTQSLCALGKRRPISLKQASAEQHYSVSTESSY